MHHNVVAQTSQMNFHQNQQSNNQQPMQSQQYYCYPTNQQDIRNFPNFQSGQSYQQDPYINQSQPHQIPRQGNIQLPQQSYNLPSIMQNQGNPYGSSLPINILDQFRPYIGNSPPIFILPQNCQNPVAVPQPPQLSSPTQVCPGIGINCPSSSMHYPQNSCYPCHIPFINFFPNANSPTKEIATKNCDCCILRNAQNFDNNEITNMINNNKKNNDEHRCINGNDDTICTKKNCPSSINLQALVSQLLAIQGTISCAATRLVLRKIPGSNVTTTIEETIERAKRSLNGMTQEQLLTEKRNSQQINALINLHMTANPPPSVIPILTSVQLKVNQLKSYVDTLINRRLIDSQGIDGAEGNKNFDPTIISMKTDQELRDLLATLRKKECEERVNLNFSPYQSQRVIAQSRLSNVQNKISQIETEMDKRRNLSIGKSFVAQQYSDPGCGSSWYGYTGDISNSSSFGVEQNYHKTTKQYDSPDPFRIQIKNPKRLNLQPHVGSPETTYERQKKNSRKISRSRKDTSDDDDDDDDCEEIVKNLTRDKSNENHRCACDKSSDDESADDGKKKLGGKIIVAKKIVKMNEDVDDDKKQKSCLSIIKLSSNIVIVIDNSSSKITKEETTNEKKEIVETELISIDSEDDKKFVDNLIIEQNDNDKFLNVELEKNDENYEEKFEVPTNEFSRINEKFEDNENEENNEKVQSSEKIDYTKKSEGPSMREQTIRMITKIDYESSVPFRAFTDNNEKPEKDEIIEEQYKGSFTENSIKSNESIADHTPESISLRVEDYEIIANETNNNHETSLDKEVQIDNIADQQLTVNKNEEYEEEKIVKCTNYSNEMEQTNYNNHNCENEMKTMKEIEGSKIDNEETEEENLPSNDLSTIGNHVESFNSIIDKIASLKFQQFEESKETFFDENSISENSSKINIKVNEKNDNETKNEIGKWKFIKFSEFKEKNENFLINDENIDSDKMTYVLPKIKHTVIEDKNKGEKYVVIEEPNEDRNKKFGEPYKTGRSLIIRSRLKNSQSNSSEKTGPFTLVKSPKHREKNCLPLRIVSSKSNEKNRWENTHELKSSDKFWIRTDIFDSHDKIIETKNIDKIVDRQSQVEKSKISSKEQPINENQNFVDSSVSVVDEKIVEVHDFF